MQLIITDAWMAKSRAIHLSGAKLILAFVVFSVLLIVVAALFSHWIYSKGSREGWVVVNTLAAAVGEDDTVERDKYMRENIDVMARKLGEIQAKLLQLESLGDRVSGLAGIKTTEVSQPPGQGGVLLEARSLTMTELETLLNNVELLTQQRTDLLTVLESRLFEQKMKKLTVPTRQPVLGSELGSAFGWRLDPVTGRSALHTGLDYPAAIGTPIYAAAGGVVVTEDYHPQYGKMLEIDHGNKLVTRYAHASKVLVEKGDLIKFGQKIAEVGNTGRSTGPHLHFEVLVHGIPQDPQKFLLAGRKNAPTRVASAK